jgi:hypothetical protein
MVGEVKGALAGFVFVWRVGVKDAGASSLLVSRGDAPGRQPTVSWQPACAP